VNEEGRIVVSVNHFTKFAVFAYAPKSFADLGGHWAETYTERLVGMGVIDGFEDGTFRPEAEVTRAQFAKMISEALGLASSGASPAFDDDAVTPDWAKRGVAAAAAAGLIRGYENDGRTTFRGHQAITRAEMAAMLARALSSDASRPGAATRLEDEEQLPEWAKAAIRTVVDAGIINGYDDGTFRPSQAVTRAETAAMIYRLLEVLHI